MKSGSKVLIGVLSVAALVGTGVATWTVGGGYHEKETETVTPEIATIGSRDVDLDVVIDADEGDHPIRFDNPSLQDLSVTYHVTGKKGADAADDFDPFTYNYSTVASEYQPNLSWETTVYRDGSPVGKDDAFFDYVVAPKGEMKYSVWLISGGKDVTLTFEWSEEILGGLNPQIYINEHKSQYPTKDSQTEFFTKLNEALDVTFKFTFKVGGLTETPVETPTTGEVTLPTVENGTLSIEGMTGNTIPAGEHTITITTNEGYVLTDNKLSVIENGETKEVTMTENALTRAASHTYTGKYDFKENATYNFSYAVEEETVVTPVEKYAVTFNQPENGKIEVKNGEIALDTGTEVEEGTKLTYTVTPNEGYHIASISVNGEAVDATFDGVYTDEVTVTSATSISATMEADVVEPIEIERGKLGLEQSTLHKALYFTGKMDGFYFETTDNYIDAVDVIVYEVEGGVTLRIGEDGQYIAARVNEGHNNIIMQNDVYTWSYSEEYDAYYTNLGGTDYWIGNSQSFDTLSLNDWKYIESAGNNIAHVVQEEIKVEPVPEPGAIDIGSELKAGTFKLGYYQGNLGGYYYFNGKTANTYYGGTTRNFDEAVNVTVDIIDAESKIFTMKLDNGNYISGVKSGTHYNFVFNTETAFNWTFDDEHRISCELEGTKCYIGTYDTNATFSLSTEEQISDTNYLAHLYEKEAGSDTPVVTEDPVESVEISNKETELEVGKTLQLSSKVLPETANQEVTYAVTSGNEFADVSETGLVTAKAEGEVTITVTTKGLNSSEQAVTDTINLNIIAATVTDVFTSAGIYEYDVRLNGGSYSADKAELIEVLKVGDKDSSNQIVSATIIDKVYSDTTYEGIKLSTTKGNGSFSITTKDDICKIKVGIIGWTESGIGLSIDNGINAAVTYSLDGEGDKTTVTYFEFEFENASKNFTFTATKRLAIAYLEFFTK